MLSLGKGLLQTTRIYLKNEILHYTLGFQPQRTGGLVKYAEDLILEQIAQGHQVTAYIRVIFGYFRKSRNKEGIIKTV